MLGLIALPWGIGFLFATDAILTAVGLPPGDRPLSARLVLVGLGLAPGIGYGTADWLGRVKGFRWLLASPQPCVRIDREGIEITLPDDGARRFNWDDVAELRRVSTWRGCVARLVGADGTTLAVLPESLVYPRLPWRGPARSLAQYVVEVRPDRYALSGANWAGWADAFAIRRTGATFNPEAADRRRTRITHGIGVILGGATFALLWVLFISRQSPPGA